MQFVNYKTLLYSDTPVPDIFISEYLPALKGDYVKIYIYCLFLTGKNRGPDLQELSRVLDLPPDAVKNALHYMANLNLLTWSEEGVVIKDLKEIEINRNYTPKSTSSPEDAADRGRLNTRRRQVTEAINNTFFSGVMSPSWYIDIDVWFERYGFDEDVMMLLFGHCRDNGSLTKPYIAKVAENMHTKGVRNSFDFDRYIRSYQTMKTVSGQISKKLMIGPLNVYQEEYVDKWVNKYGFTFDIIEQALRMTTRKPSAGFNYFDTPLTEWYKLELDTLEKVLAYQARRKITSKKTTARRTAGAGNEAGGAAIRGAGPVNRNQGGFVEREYMNNELDQYISSKFGGDGEAGPIDDGAHTDSDGNEMGSG